MFDAPETAAVNCAVPPAETLDVPGVSVTLTGLASGLTVIKETPNFVGSATLVAFRVTKVGLLTAVGAVYNPVACTDPTAGLMLQVTARLPVFVTNARARTVPPALIDTTAGSTVTAMGTTLRPGGGSDVCPNPEIAVIAQTATPR